MTSDFDLALGLFRSSPSRDAIEDGLQRLTDHLRDTRPFGGDLEALWSPVENGPSNIDASAAGWLIVQSIAPIWLSRMARPARGEGSLEGVLYQIYCRSLDQPTGASLRDLGFFYRTPNHPRALDLCIDLLTLRHFPSRFLPEIIGVTLAHRSMEQTGISLQSAQHPWALTVLENALSSGVDALRVRKGFALYRDAAIAVFSDQGHWGPRQSYRETFARIVSKKAEAASGYHAKIRLENQSLDDWFKTHAKNPDPLLRALEKSPLVDPACPYASRLIKAMDFGGPMFGVFEGPEREAAVRWIASPDSVATTHQNPEELGMEAPWGRSDRPSVRTRPKGNRELFHQLVAAENSAEVPSDGKRLIQRILQRSRQLQRIRLLPQAFRYSPSRLKDFLNERHAAALKPPKRPFFSTGLSREDWRWTLTQLSPAVLVDGAWLAGVAGAPSQLRPWHLELIKIHEDELGNGDPEQNHPRIYRRLLESLDIDLPAIADPAFIQDPRIHSKAFTFPSYMVAMGWHYSEFEPECLGLNLAIEMSGLGSGYQQVIESMKQAKIDPLIAELHLSIDNLASGHARRARDAIVLYLENIARTEGGPGETKAWQRVHRGFLSYRVALFEIGLLILARYLISRNTKISK